MKIAKGGIGMTTIVYCATEADGRIDDEMLYMHANAMAAQNTGDCRTAPHFTVQPGNMPPTYRMKRK